MTKLSKAAGSLMTIIIAIGMIASCNNEKVRLTQYVDPFLGTATLWDSADLGFQPHFGKDNPFGEGKRIWGAETHPGSALPNAMVQLSPVTMFGSGGGYQREDTLIYGFSHTNKGHWNLCNIPLMPVNGEFSYDDYCSHYSHNNESASVGYYQVYLDRYNVNVELTSTLRCGYHKYTFKPGDDKKVFFDLSHANDRVRSWDYKQVDEYTMSGVQNNMHFYAVANFPIAAVDTLQVRRMITTRAKDGGAPVMTPSILTLPVVTYDDKSGKPLEIQIGFSYVSAENAKMNLEAEMLGKSFDQVHNEAVDVWENMLSKITVKGGTEREKGIFYSCLYRAVLWPILMSDVNGEFTDPSGKVVNPGFRYYTTPSYWDTHRNKLVLLEMLSPDVCADIISSESLRGDFTGFMPIQFCGDHASTFVTGSYKRGIRNFDVQKAYKHMLHNATVENRAARPFLDFYNEHGYVPELDIENPETPTTANVGVTRTLEYAYDDYCLAQLAKELGDNESYEMLMARTKNYKNVFDPSTRFMRGKTEEGKWISHFDPYFPYFTFQYREANGWQGSFYAPHDPEGLIGLWPSEQEFEAKLDSLYTEPWGNFMWHNFTGFLGNYCQGNQPDHNYTYLYYYVGKQPKAQNILNILLDKYYAYGPENLALSGMDDAGEMSTWYVFNAIGLYTFSPADPEYIVTVPLFDEVDFKLGDNTFKIVKNGEGNRIDSIVYDGKTIDGYYVQHADLLKGKTLEINVSDDPDENFMR